MTFIDDALNGTEGIVAGVYRDSAQEAYLAFEWKDDKMLPPLGFNLTHPRKTIGDITYVDIRYMSRIKPTDLNADEAQAMASFESEYQCIEDALAQPQV